MKKKLDYFYVGNDYGGDQEALTDFVMKMGGCAAVTACDICVYLTKYMGEDLCDFDANSFDERDYVKLTKTMKHYLHPRFSGVNTTKLFIDGFNEYLTSKGSNIKLSSLEGGESVIKAKELIKSQIDNGYPIPSLTLYHKNRDFKDYNWHWYIINGYEEFEDTMMVKVVSYGNWRWFDFDELWSTHHTLKGGLIKIEK